MAKASQEKSGKESRHNPANKHLGPPKTQAKLTKALDDDVLQ